MDSTNSQPIIWSAVSLNNATGGYEYTAAFLPAGTCTLALTCLATDDDPEVDDPVAFVSVIGADNVAVTAGETTTFDFTAP